MLCIRDACNDLLTLGWKAIAVTKSTCWKQQRHSFLDMCHNLGKSRNRAHINPQEMLDRTKLYTGMPSQEKFIASGSGPFWLRSNHNLKFYLLFEVWNWKLPKGDSDKRIYMHYTCTGTDNTYNTRHYSVLRKVLYQQLILIWTKGCVKWFILRNPQRRAHDLQYTCAVHVPTCTSFPPSQFLCHVYTQHTVIVW